MDFSSALAVSSLPLLDTGVGRISDGSAIATNFGSVGVDDDRQVIDRVVANLVSQQAYNHVEPLLRAASDLRKRLGSLQHVEKINQQELLNVRQAANETTQSMELLNVDFNKLSNQNSVDTLVAKAKKNVSDLIELSNRVHENQRLAEKAIVVVNRHKQVVRQLSFTNEQNKKAIEAQIESLEKITPGRFFKANGTSATKSQVGELSSRENHNSPFGCQAASRDPTPPPPLPTCRDQMSLDSMGYSGGYSPRSESSNSTRFSANMSGQALDGTLRPTIPSVWSRSDTSGFNREASAESRNGASLSAGPSNIVPAGGSDAASANSAGILNGMSVEKDGGASSTEISGDAAKAGNGRAVTFSTHVETDEPGTKSAAGNVQAVATSANPAADERAKASNGVNGAVARPAKAGTETVDTHAATGNRN
eukprot:TRINITY_DN3394_c0_g2_i1.p1 TRINITY_DN3394_c0_g2~~TRINITY_DN3394_c0_g2_i1.p1  ORF type:complete len:423 (-),score=67.50 TRINITY_DN3394_c0_g2_i1:54-1322(-)